MRDFTFDEINLMCIYNTGTRAGLVQALTDMRGQLEPPRCICCSVKVRH